MNAADTTYSALVQRVLTTGCKRSDRTGTGTLSLFGEHMQFDLTQGFPLLTTKRVWWKGVVEELLWFLRGSTSAAELAAKGVHIWDDYGRDDLGPIYGAQWKRQLPQLIQNIKDDPFSRRHVVSAWNVDELDQMVLPPCHMSFQFYVDDKGGLSCHMYQRSADIGVGVPFNIASYALLTHMVAQVCDLEPKMLYMSFGDAHIYYNHVEQLLEQVERKAMPLPTLVLDKSVRDLFDFESHHIKLEGYKHAGVLKMPMNV